MTWRKVDHATEHLARSLRASGVEPGAAVAIQLPNVVELVISILACARLGAVSVPFPIQHRQHELGAGFASAGITTIITSARPDRPTQLDDVAEVLTDFPDVRLVVFGDAGPLFSAQPTTRSTAPGVLPPSTAAAAPPPPPVSWSNPPDPHRHGSPKTSSSAPAAGRYGTQGLESP